MSNWGHFGTFILPFRLHVHDSLNINQISCYLSGLFLLFISSYLVPDLFLLCVTFVVVGVLHVLLGEDSAVSPFFIFNLLVIFEANFAEF